MNPVDKIMMAAQAMSVRVKDPRKLPVSASSSHANKFLAEAVRTLDPDAIDSTLEELSFMLADGAVGQLQAFLAACANAQELKLAHMLAVDTFNVCGPGGPKLVAVEEGAGGIRSTLSLGGARDGYLIDVAMPVTLQLDPGHDDNEGLAEPREFDLEIIKGFAHQMLSRMRLPSWASIEGEWSLKAPVAKTAAQQILADGKWFSRLPVHLGVALGTSCLQPTVSKVLVTMEPKLFFCCATVKVVSEAYAGRHNLYAGLYPSDLSDSIQAAAMQVVHKVLDERLLMVLGAPMLAGHSFEIARSMMRQACLLAFAQRCVSEGSKVEYAFGRDTSEQAWMYVRSDDDAIALPISPLESWDSFCYSFLHMFNDSGPVQIPWSANFLLV